MTAKLHHECHPNDSMVVLVMERGGVAHRTTVSEHQAKAFAWGILSDLDDEVFEDQLNAKPKAASSPDVPRSWRVTRTERRILGAFLDGGVVSRDWLMTTLYGRARAPNPKILDVFVFKLRRKLAARGITIETVRGEGFILPSASKAILRNAIAGEASTPASCAPFL